MLRPMAKFCLRNSTGVQELLEAAKHVFILVASSEMECRGEKVNVSRLSLMTGIHRRDVIRIYKEGESKESPQGVAIRVIGQWSQDKRYLTAGGKPRTLGFEGEENQFRELVENTSKDINPGTVLFELERIGAVEKTSRGLKLKQSFYKADSTNLEGFRIMSRDAEDLLSAVDENIHVVEDLPNLHVRTEFDNISKEALPEIRQWILNEGSKYHKKIRSYLASFDKDINPKTGGTGGVRVVVGSFSRTVENNKVEERKKRKGNAG